MVIPLAAIGALASAGSAGMNFLGGRKRRRAARQARREERGKLGRAREKLTDLYRRRGIQTKEQNIGLEGSSVAKGRENQLAQRQAWDFADMDSADKLASIQNRMALDAERQQNFRDISGVVGGTAAGLSGMFPASQPPLPSGYTYGQDGNVLIQGGYDVQGIDDDEEIRKLLGLP